jgi:hypothetical protein
MSSEVMIMQLMAAYPRLDRNLIEMALQFDEQMKQRHGDDYDAESTVCFQPCLQREELRFPEGPVLPMQPARPCIMPLEAGGERAQSFCEISEVADGGEDERLPETAPLATECPSGIDAAELEHDNRRG